MAREKKKKNKQQESFLFASLIWRIVRGCSASFYEQLPGSRDICLLYCGTVRG